MNGRPLPAGLDWNDDGYATLSGVLLARFRELDGLFGDWASGMGATEYRFPGLIAIEKLRPVRYLASFPHLATLATTFRREQGALARCASEYGRAASVPVAGEYHEPSRQLLTPSACYHFYPMLSGRNLRDPVRMTTRCTCHRREASYAPLRRQWCFSMRELVCIGDDESIDWFVDDCRRRIDWLVDSLGITAGWRPASDPFFDPDNDPKALAQRVAPAKQELCLADGLAIGSINEHRSYFGDAYDIRVGGAPARSACVAFGLERWLWALAERFGTDPACWPDLSRGWGRK